MPEQTSPEQVPVHEDVRYEKSDARLGPFLLFGAGLIVAGVIIQGAIVLLFDAFKKTVAEEDQPLSSLAARERLQFPKDIGKIPAPILQQSETKDLDHLREAEDARLNSYGWVDAQAGIVHIPIGEAMKVLADPKRAVAHGIRAPAAAQKGGLP